MRRFGLVRDSARRVPVSCGRYAICVIGGMDLLLLDRSRGIVTLTLNNPPLNVLTIELLEALERAFSKLAFSKAAEDVRAVVIRSRGRHFSAGADVEEHLPKQGDKMLRGLERTFRVLHQVRVPTVAVVRGSCLGAGLELAVACDMMLVAQAARLAVPEIRLGVIAPIAAIDLPARTGRTIDGTEAARIGLALDVVPDDMLDARCEDLAEGLGALSARALRASKEAVREAAGRPYTEALSSVCAVYRAAVLDSRDGIEGLSAFLEKREPVWTHQ